MEGMSQFRLLQSIFQYQSCDKAKWLNSVHEWDDRRTIIPAFRITFSSGDSSSQFTHKIRVYQCQTVTVDVITALTEQKSNITNIRERAKDQQMQTINNSIVKSLLKYKGIPC